MESSSASQELNEQQEEFSLTSSTAAMAEETIRPVSRTGTPTTIMGKHRLAAAIVSLNQQIQIIQEELDQLDSYGEASIVCRELVSSVESMPDPLLPVTRGPIYVQLDRWFHEANASRRHKRWI